MEVNNGSTLSVCIILRNPWGRGSTIPTMKKRNWATTIEVVACVGYLATLIGFGYMYYGLGHPPLTEADGMRWRPTGGAGMLQGAKAADGTVLIPQEYDEVKYHPNRLFGGYFTVQRGDTVACFDRQGRCLIPLERGYTHIRLTGDFDPWFDVGSLEGYGACYLTGEEVIAPPTLRWSCAGEGSFSSRAGTTPDSKPYTTSRPDSSTTIYKVSRPYENSKQTDRSACCRRK